MLHVQTRHKINILQCSCPSLGLGAPGYKMGGVLFLQYILPFSLRSALFLSDEFSSALEWIIRTKLNIFRVIHILDDFFFTTSSPR